MTIPSSKTPKTILDDPNNHVLKSQIERIAKVLRYIAVDGPADLIIHQTGEISLRSPDNCINAERMSLDEFLVSFDLCEDSHSMVPGIK